ncbi:hypothetical protein EDD18DRAFT_1114482 [Armillaria luteobubalina]|uniref:Uncharacterized protein n=1 Tax=Armillaria luteobubalina TaxID=153913 RepID=A0AA39UD91_9AGAR|nr:hypothetical protein EDD18DRAFT_1114482 [Armillaria luteobubalina]
MCEVSKQMVEKQVFGACITTFGPAIPLRNSPNYWLTGTHGTITQQYIAAALDTTLCEETTIVKSKAPGALTWDDYDSMAWLNTVIKVGYRSIIFWDEVLQYHPSASGFFHEASQDNVLPLVEPIITSDGKSCSEIPISKGQVISASVYTYNQRVQSDSFPLFGETMPPNGILAGFLRIVGINGNLLASMQICKIMSLSQKY